MPCDARGWLDVGLKLIPSQLHNRISNLDVEPKSITLQKEVGEFFQELMASE